MSTRPRGQARSTPLPRRVYHTIRYAVPGLLVPGILGILSSSFQRPIIRKLDAPSAAKVFPAELPDAQPAADPVSRSRPCLLSFSHSPIHPADPATLCVLSPRNGALRLPQSAVPVRRVVGPDAGGGINHSGRADVSNVPSSDTLTL